MLEIVSRSTVDSTLWTNRLDRPMDNNYFKVHDKPYLHIPLPSLVYVEVVYILLV